MELVESFEEFQKQSLNYFLAKYPYKIPWEISGKIPEEASRGFTG